MRALGAGEAWFVVLPDCQAAGAVADTVGASASQVIAHASGRPWLVGRWAANELVLAQAGQVKVAVIGCCPVTATELSAAAGRVRTTADLDRVAAGLSGSFHLVASIGGQVRVQGSISELRRVFSTQVGGVTVAADRADLLAKSSEAALDERWLAACLLGQFIPRSLAEQSPWQTVQALAGGCCLLLDRDGSHRIRRWWTPPEPVMGLAEAAPIVGQALLDAVDARTRVGGTISADLSGGLDSTSVCFLTARTASRLVTLTMSGIDVTHEDAAWAERAAVHLDGVERVVLAPQQLPSVFADMADAGGGLDEPYTGTSERARVGYRACLLVERGCRLHLCGHGGDEVMTALPSYMHTLVRTHPRIAVDHLRGYRALYRWPLAATLRELADRRAYQTWLAAQAQDLTGPAPSPHMPNLGWELGPARLPAWVTPNTADATVGLLQQAAAAAQPLASTRGQHAALTRIHSGARKLRHLVRIQAKAGLALAAPYLDDRVIQACLAVRLHERATPWCYKPLLAQAMRGLVPSPVLQRTTKGAFNAEWHAGWRRHHGDLKTLLDDPILAQLGIIDADALRAVCLTGSAPPTPLMAPLSMTFACEAWLRALTPATAPERPFEQSSKRSPGGWS
jgi:asparagine synthase (glutamine-hydrolysing)